MAGEIAARPPCQAAHDEFERRLRELLSQYPMTSFAFVVVFPCGATIDACVGTRQELYREIERLLNEIDRHTLPGAVPPPRGLQ